MNSFLETFNDAACDTMVAPQGNTRASTATLPTRPWMSLLRSAGGVLLGSLLSVTTALGAPAFFADAALTQPGLVGSYINQSLRGAIATNDWRLTQPVAGTRTDTNLVFSPVTWGDRAPLGLTGGTGTRWADFSVQWDGYARIDQAGDRFAAVSNEGSRTWIDRNCNGTFEADEVLDNHWGHFSWARVGDWSRTLPAGTYRVRFQHYYEAGDNEFRLTSPAFIPRQFVSAPGNPVQVVKVIVLNFAPRIPSEGGRKLWEVFGWNDPRKLATQFKADLEFSTGGAVDIQLAEWRELEEFPLFTDGTRYTAEEYVQNRRSSNPAWKTVAADFYYYAERENLAALVNTGQVDEIWCFGDHFFNLWSQGGPSEAWMAGPGSFFINGPSFPSIGFDRAIAGYGFNYERGVAEMLHNLGHRTENHGQRAFGAWNLANPVSAFDRFSANTLDSPARLAGVGTCHVPANATAHYDYGNTQVVPSTAFDWPNYPNLTGVSTTVGRDTWGTVPYPEHHRDYLQFYFAMMPRNAGTDAQGRQANWFKYIWDFNSYEPGTGRPLEETAIAAGATVRSSGGATHEFTVRYYDGTGVDTSSLASAEVWVTGPNGYEQVATLVSIGSEVPTTGGTARTVVYRVAPPGGTWDLGDSGTYSIYLDDDQVRDTAGKAFRGGMVGQFLAEILNPAAYDIRTMLVSGAVTVTSTPLDIGAVWNLFDGDFGSLARSANINPAVVTLSFVSPVALHGFAGSFTAASNRWQVEIADSLADLDNRTGTWRAAFAPVEVAADTYSLVSLAAPVSARHVRLLVTRLERDNFVHLKEWQLLGPAPAPPQILVQPQAVTVTRTDPASPVPVQFTVSATNVLGHAWFFTSAAGTFPLRGHPWATNAETATLTLPDARRTNSGGYFVVVTNVYGSTTSSVASLRVRSPAVLPTHAGPMLLPDGRFRLCFADAEGGAPTAVELGNVEVQYATTLAGTNTVWTRLPASFNAAEGRWYVEDHAPSFAPRRFYRVIER